MPIVHHLEATHVPLRPQHGPIAVVVGDDKDLAPRAHWLAELEALLRAHEPQSLPHAESLIDAYEGMERELVQCFRHYFTGRGGFQVPSTSTLTAGASTTETFSLPREAIDTYLRLRLRARRANSFASKGDGVRDAEATSCPEPVTRMPATVPPTTTTRTTTPRRRARSAGAVLGGRQV